MMNSANSLPGLSKGNEMKRSPRISTVTQAAASRCAGRVARSAARAFARPSRPVLRVCSSSTQLWCSEGASASRARRGCSIRGVSAVSVSVDFFMVFSMTKGCDSEIIRSTHQHRRLCADGKRATVKSPTTNSIHGGEVVRRKQHTKAGPQWSLSR